jgi:hypothetical protein
MYPIAQTFYVNQPADGAAGVYLTKLELWFKSKNSNIGVIVDIRQVDNGNPTSLVLPHSSVYKAASEVQVSDNASLSTVFEFESPVFVLSNQTYAFVVMPQDSSTDYKIWTAELSGVDVLTTYPIKSNNDTGTLFLSSNGKQFTAVQTEDIKFTLYNAVFKYNQGQAVYKGVSEDLFLVNDYKGGSFLPTERVYLANSTYSLAKLTYSGNTGNFIVGETVYQSNSTANVALGKIYLNGGYVMKLTNTTGNWVLSEYPDFVIHGALSNKTANVTAISQSIGTVMGTNNITVPFTDGFSSEVNSVVYISNPAGTISQITKINSVVDTTTLALNTKLFFTTDYAEFGKVHGNGYLTGLYNGPSLDQIADTNNAVVPLQRVTSNSVLNFENSAGKRLIGLNSKVSANVIYPIDSTYNSLYIDFANANPPSTNISYSFRGANNDPSRTLDGSPIPIDDRVTLELFDKERIINSKSKELGSYGGDASFTLYADLKTEEPLLSPVLDDLQSTLNFTKNIICPETDLVGFVLTVSNSNSFSIGDVVSQGNSTSSQYAVGNIIRLIDNTIVVANTFDYEFRETSITDSNLVKVACTAVNTTITLSEKYGEALDNKTHWYASRYISKSVILEEGQDAEDLRCYLTAYRPAGTNLRVYVKIKNNNDPSNFSNRNWTAMISTSDSLNAPLLLSSSSNKNDFVELEYEFPRSKELYGSDCTCDSTDIITLPSTENILNTTRLYIKDNTPDSLNFNVTRVKKVLSSTEVQLRYPVTFSSSNCAVGRIRWLNHVYSPFIYTENNNIVRYMDQNGVVHDGFKQFAIKIVPISNTSYNYPRVHDMRALALQI